MIHIPHILFRDPHGDVQIWVESHQLLDGGTHREHTTGDGGAAGVDKGIIAEHLWESFYHPISNLTVLALTQSCKVTPASLGVINDMA